MRVIGNDIVDLLHSSVREHREIFTGGGEEWMKRHLTGDEWSALAAIPAPERGRRFWLIFALKEAASKAVSQLGYFVPYGSFTHFEVDLGADVVRHATGLDFRILVGEANNEWAHAVVADCASSVRPVIEVIEVQEERQSELLREAVRESIRARYGVAGTCIEKDGRANFYAAGRALPASLSHSGRFAAFGWIPEEEK